MKLSIYPQRKQSPMSRRRSINQIRNWRASIQRAYDITAGGGLETALILHYWRGTIYRDDGPSCVRRYRNERAAARRRGPRCDD